MKIVRFIVYEKREKGRNVLVAMSALQSFGFRTGFRKGDESRVLEELESFRVMQRVGSSRAIVVAGCECLSRFLECPKRIMFPRTIDHRSRRPL